MKKKYVAFAFLFFVFIRSALFAQCTASIVPYFEDFQSITQTNQLPACWAASSPSAACLTFTTPNNYAAFYLNPGGVNYFYSRGLQLITGVTYSAALFYKNDMSSGSTGLSIMVGSSQSPTGLVSIGSVVGLPGSTTYSLLSGLFTVPANGAYYIAVRGTGSGTTAAQYLNWDDLSVTYACDPTNSGLATNTICSGQNMNLIPNIFPGWNGLSYLWSTGATTSVISVSPSISALYWVSATSTLTGCLTDTYTFNVTVFPSPTISVSSNTNNVCAGQSATLTATGANSYAWSNGAIGSQIVINPNTTTNYSVAGTNTFGCSTMNSIMISVIPAPVMSINPVTPTVCAGQTITLSVSGANSYVWNTGANIPTIVVNPITSTVYTVVGTYTNACTRTQVFNLIANPLPDIEIIASQHTICATTEIALDGSGAQTYTWTYDGNTSNDASIYLNPLSTITYTLRGTDANGCIGQETVSVWVNACIGLNGNVINETLKIFPNPTNAVFCIENAGDCTLSVYDLRGRKLFDEELNAGLPVIDISALSVGLYILKIQSAEKAEFRKIVRE